MRRGGFEGIDGAHHEGDLVFAGGAAAGGGLFDAAGSIFIGGDGVGFES